MVIKRSSATEVAGLLQDLERGDATAREAAAARLAVIGTRAVGGLLQVLGAAADPQVRAAALAALEGIGDARAIEPAFAALGDPDPGVAAAAVGVLKASLDSERGTAVLDRLTQQALDTSRPVRARLAAIEALREVPASVTAPLWARLLKDADAMVRAAAGEPEMGGAAGDPEPAAALAAAAQGVLPDPDLLRRWLATAGATTPLPVLHRLIETLRHHEAAANQTARAAWMTARAAAHVAIAAHGSTVALYDLRETVEREDQVPAEMLSALARIGDRSCLEPIAAAYARSATEGGDARRQENLLAAFREIADRVGLTPRHAEARRIRSRWPAEASALLSLPRR